MLFALTAGGASQPGLVAVVRVRRRARQTLLLHGEGMAGLGIDPARLLIIETRDERELLRVGLDAARNPALAAAVLETWGPLPAYELTASRRLVLAAERTGVGVVVLRGDAPPRASAAQTRWLIRAAPSTAWPARAPGGPAIEAELLRRRGGAAGMCWQLEWDRDHGIFREMSAGSGRSDAPLSGAVVPLAGLRTASAIPAADRMRSRAA